MSGAAVEKACRAVAERGPRTGRRPATASPSRPPRACETGRHGQHRWVRSTSPWGTARRRPGRGVGAPHAPRHVPDGSRDRAGRRRRVSWIFAAHRAVVDVDPDLGLVRVVQVTTGQDVGIRSSTPMSVVGQIEGGISQGVGPGGDGGDHPGRRNRPEPVVHRLPDPDLRRHARRRGDDDRGSRSRRTRSEPRASGRRRALSSTPAVAAAIRAATGLELPRVPVRPQDIALTLALISSPPLHVPLHPPRYCLGNRTQFRYGVRDRTGPVNRRQAPSSGALAGIGESSTDERGLPWSLVEPGGPDVGQTAPVTRRWCRWASVLLGMVRLEGMSTGLVGV